MSPETRCSLSESFSRIQAIFVESVKSRLWLQNVARIFGVLAETLETGKSENWRSETRESKHDELYTKEPEPPVENDGILIGLFNTSLIIGLLQFTTDERILLSVKKCLQKLTTSKNAPTGWTDANFFYTKVGDKYGWYESAEFLKFNGTKTQIFAHFITCFLVESGTDHLVLVNERLSGSSTVLKNITRKYGICNWKFDEKHENSNLEKSKLYKLSDKLYSGDGARFFIEDLNVDRVTTMVLT